MASPIGDAGAGFGVVPDIGSLAHDLDPELAVGEVAVVESEAEIGVGRRRGAPGEVRVDDRPQVEQIRIKIPHRRRSEPAAKKKKTTGSETRTKRRRRRNLQSPNRRMRGRGREEKKVKFGAKILKVGAFVFDDKKVIFRKTFTKNKK